MLIDELVAACSEAYNNSDPGNCGVNCNNSDSCAGGCDYGDGCLEQVHWWPQKGGRSDYECDKLLCCYVQKYSQSYSQNVLSVASKINFDQYPRYDILSIGCGGAPDLMAFERLAEGKSVYYKGFDRNKRWKGIHELIESYADETDNIEVNIKRRDIFEVLAENKPSRHSYNIVVIQFLISHLVNTNQINRITELYNGIINNVVSNRLQGSPFLFILNDIDTLNKGRNNFYRLIDLLEQNGYRGNSYAKSCYPNGDLGAQRWSDSREHNSFGNISYSFSQSYDLHQGAQLIIELR